MNIKFISAITFASRQGLNLSVEQLANLVAVKDCMPPPPPPPPSKHTHTHTHTHTHAKTFPILGSVATFDSTSLVVWEQDYTEAAHSLGMRLMQQQQCHCA